ncbi:hypothetical protein TNCV_694051 [Trichonephila clavipes]|nr:hypothetical protein TNCV_694051 [Trichonephila clavipes]
MCPLKTSGKGLLRDCLSTMMNVSLPEKTIEYGQSLLKFDIFIQDVHWYDIFLLCFAPQNRQNQKEHNTRVVNFRPGPPPRERFMCALLPVAVYYLRDLKEVIFQKGNKISGVVCHMLTFLEVESVRLMPMPERSPDLLLFVNIQQQFAETLSNHRYKRSVCLYL